MRRNEQDLASQPVRNTITNPAMVTKTSGTDTLLINYAANPTFEGATHSTATIGGTHATWTSSGIVTDRAHSGTKSFKRATCTVAGQASCKALANPLTSMKVTKGQKLSWSFWVYSTVAGTISPYWEGAKVADGAYVGGGATAVTVAANQWTYVSGTSTAPHDSYVHGAGGYSLAVNVGDSVWFDDFCITQTDAPVAYFDGSTPASNGYTYSWAGTANLSASVRKASAAIVRTNLVCNPTFKGGTLSNIRVNNVMNPSFRTTSGTTDVRKNLATNPSFEATSGTPTVRTNLFTHPNFELSSGTTNAHVNYSTNPSMETAGSAIVTRTNLATNPAFELDSSTIAVRTNSCNNPSLATNATGWTTYGGASTHTDLVTSRAAATWSTSGYAWKVEGTATSLPHMAEIGIGDYPVGAGVPVSVSVRVIAGATRKARIRLRFTGAGSPDVWSPDFTLNAITPTLMSFTATAPAGTTSVSVNIKEAVTPDNFLAGDWIAGSMAMVEINSLVSGPYFDGATPSNVRTNLVTEGRATNYTVAWGKLGWRNSRWFGGGAGAGTYSLVTGASDGPTSDLTTYARKTWTVTGNTNGDTGFDHGHGGVNALPISPNTSYTASSYLRVTGVGKTTAGNLAMHWYDTAGTFIVASYPASNSTLPNGTWVRLTTTAVAPANAAYLLVISDVDSGTLWAPGESLDGTGLMVEQTSTVGAYFDGATPATGGLTHSWIGAANASQSVARDPDFSYTWAATAHASTSYERAPGVAGISLNISGNAGVTSRVYQTLSGKNGKGLKIFKRGGHVFFDLGLTGLTSSASYTISYDILTDQTSILSVDRGITGASIYSPTVHPVTAGVWTRVSRTITVGAGETTRNVSVAGWENASASDGSTVIVDNLLIEQSNGALPYFDGSTAAEGNLTYAWTGTVNASSSEQRGVNVSGRTGLPPNGTSWQSTTYTRTGTKSAAVLVKNTLATDSSVWYPAGDISVGAGAGQVPANTVMTWSVYVYIPTGSAAKVQLMEVTSGVRGTASATLYDQWQRISLTFTTPASGTFFLRMRTVGTNPAGSTLWVDSEMIEATSSPTPYFDGSNPMQNLVTNPSFATNTTGWSPISSTLTRVTNQGGDGHVCEIAQTTDGGVRNTAIWMIGSDYNPGSYTVSFDMKGTDASFTNVRAFCYDTETALVRAQATTPLIKDGNYNRYTFNLQADGVFDKVYMEAQGVGIPIGTKVWLDRVKIERADTASTMYYEGTGDFTYSWTGTANASSSIKTAPSLSGWASGAPIYRSALEPKMGTYCGAVETRGINGDGLWQNLPNLDVTAGRTYTYSAWVRTTTAHALTAAFRWFDAGGAQVGSDTSYVVTSQIVVGSWSLVSATAAAPATTTKLQMMLRIYETHTPTTFYVDGAICAESNTVIPYFDGSTAASGDFTYAWSGAVNASTSLQRGAGVVENPVLNAVPISSTEWKVSGTKSMRLVPHFTHINDTFCAVSGDTGALRLGMLAGRTYTISATIRLSAPLTGTLSSRSRKIVFFHKSPADQFHIETPSAQPANVAGETRLSVTVTIPDTATEAFVRLYNGATAGNGDVWWDNLLVEESTVLRPYFDGTNPAFQNLATNHGLETDANGWATNDASLYPAARSTVSPIRGNASYLATRTATNPNATAASIWANGVGALTTLKVKPGEVYSFSLDVKVSQSNRRVNTYIAFRDISGASIGTGGSIYTNVTNGVSTRVGSAGVTIPANADSILCVATVSSVDGSVTVAGEETRFDGLLIETSPTISEYYSGTGDFTYAWSGTADASTSAQRGTSVVGNSASKGGPPTYPTSQFFSYQSVDETGKKIGRWLTPSGSGFSGWRVVNINSNSLNYTSIVAGSTYTLLFRYRSSGWGSGQTFDVSMRDPGAGNVVIGNDTAKPLNTGWTEYRRTFTALINGLASTNLYISLPTTPQATTDGVFDISEWALVEGTYNGPFFDGSTAASSSLSYGWSGTADASISYEKATALSTGTYTVESKLATYVSSSGTFIAYVKEPNGAGGRSFVPTSVPGQIISFVEGKKYTVKMRGRKFNSATGYRLAGTTIQEMPLTTSMATHTMTFTANAVPTLYVEHPQSSNDAGTEWEYFGIYEEGDPIAYFDGDTSGFDGLIHRWKGTPYASQSEQIGAAVAGYTQEPNIRRWALADGAMRTINISGTTHSLQTASGSMVSGRVHTVLFRAKLNGSATNVKIYGLANTPTVTLTSSYAWYRVTGVADSTTLYFSTNAAPSGSGFDMSHLMVVEGTYTGGYVDGNSYGAVWEGTAHAATSLGNPTSLESIAGKPLFSATASGNYVLSSADVAEAAPRTIYSIVDNTADIVTAGQAVALSYGINALNDTIPNKYIILRQQGDVGPFNNVLTRRTLGGGPVTPWIPSAGRHILIAGINSSGFLFSGFDNTSLTVDNLAMSIPHERIIIEANSAYHNHVITYVYAGFHNDAMRAEIIKLLALKHNVPLT